MYPWLWFWAPHFHFPFGNFAQDIEPKTDWFFGAIKPEAGNADVEKKIFDVVSYGKQLGLITEILLSQGKDHTIAEKKAADSRAELKALYLKIEQVKKESEAQSAATIIALLDKLRARDPEQFERVLKTYTAKAGP